MKSNSAVVETTSQDYVLVDAAMVYATAKAALERATRRLAGLELTRERMIEEGISIVQNNTQE
jgi:NAD(P)-dependent dehydrogenase (short-subunit alcohol dehydrogenase family)